MVRLNRDTVTAVVLLAFAGGAFWQTFDIQTRNDGVMRANVWPRAIIAVLIVLSVIHLVQSLRDAAPATPKAREGQGLIGWVRYYANPLWCFGLYFAFLATLPYFGMLIGGTLLVFMILNVLGGATPRKLLLHAAIAVVSIGSMWAIFNFGLRVSLPEGELLPLVLPR